MTYSVDELAYAWPRLNASAKWRCVPEDFQVNEILGFEPDGEGEHVLLQIQKSVMPIPTGWPASWPGLPMFIRVM